MSYYRKPTGHAASLHDNMSNSVGSDSSDVTWLKSGLGLIQIKPVLSRIYPLKSGLNWILP